MGKVFSISGYLHRKAQKGRVDEARSAAADLAVALECGVCDCCGVTGSMRRIGENAFRCTVCGQKVEYK